MVGYAITIGDGAYVRNWPDTNSVIMAELPSNKVVYVMGQNYVEQVPWHHIQYDGEFGYVRADMLRMMGLEEVNAYLTAENPTPAPTEEITVAPYDPNALSSYGYVSASTVNFRESASTSSTRLRKLNKYAFCLVLGTTTVDGQTWYRVTYGDQTGYINGNYFKQMTLSELETFLGSADYQNGIQANATETDSTGSETTSGSSGTTFVSAEDQKVSTWTNPDSEIVVSYAPFDPFATPAPLTSDETNEYLNSLIKDVQNGTVSEAQLETLLKVHYQDSADKDTMVSDGLAYIRTQLGLEAATEEPTATPEINPLATIQPENPTEETTSGGSPLGLILALIAVVGLGAGGYFWYTNNKKKAAEEARKRAAAARQKQNAAAKNAGTSGRTTAGNTGTGTAPGAVSARQAARTRTGTYTEQNGRTKAQPSQNAENSGTQSRSYGKSVTNPYGRYSSRTEGSGSASYSASFRPEGSSGTTRPNNRRSRSSRYSEEETGAADNDRTSGNDENV